jgi:hypothetical protein
MWPCGSPSSRTGADKVTPAWGVEAARVVIRSGVGAAAVVVLGGWAEDEAELCSERANKPP